MPMPRTEPLIQHRKSSMPPLRRGAAAAAFTNPVFGHFNSNSLALGKEQIPAITVVDDTFEKHRGVLVEIIPRAKERISK